MSGPAGVLLSGRVLRLDPGRRIATVALPGVGRGRTWRADYAMPGEGLARVMEYDGTGRGRTAGTVVAVRPRDHGAEVDLRINVDSAWSRLADQGARLQLQCAFTHSDGPDPRGGHVKGVEIS